MPLQNEELEFKTPHIQFLLLGSSQGHILPVIKKYSPSHVVFFSSENLLEQNRRFEEEIQKAYNIGTEQVLLNPFSNDALYYMTKEIIKNITKINIKFKNSREMVIIGGVTGGTNLMAIAMALAALTMGMKVHYVIKGSKNEDNKGINKQRVMEINTLMELSEIYDLHEMSKYFLEGVP